MLLAIWRTGQDRSFRLTVDTNRIAFVDGNKDTLIGDRATVLVEQYEIGRPETPTSQALIFW